MLLMIPLASKILVLQWSNDNTILRFNEFKIIIIHWCHFIINNLKKIQELPWQEHWGNKNNFYTTDPKLKFP